MKNTIHHEGIRPNGHPTQSLKKCRDWSKSLFSIFLSLCLCAFVVHNFQNKAWAGGDASDGHSHGPEPAAPDAATVAGVSETSLHLHLSDLSRSAAGTEAPLAGAKIRGFLKRADSGEILARVSAHGAQAPGAYDVHFNGDNETIALPGAGRYELELNIQPPRGEAIDTTVPFTLKPAAAASSAAVVPLWRRALPFAPGTFALLACFVLARRLLARRKINHRDTEAQRNEKEKKTSAPTTPLLLALCLGVSAAGLTPLWAHGDEDHGDEEHGDESAAPAASAVTPSSIAEGEISSTTTAGDVRITLTARTRAAAPQALAPGEVALPPQTAQLLQIKTQPAQVSQLSSGINFNGQIAADPNAVVRVASIVPGRITRLAVAQGDRVRQGQIVAVVESRAVGEAQSAYAQAVARGRNAQSNLEVVMRQARAGVFSRAPLEAARRAQAEAAGDVRRGEAALSQARVALDNATRLARVGGFASPALEAARRAAAQANESLRGSRAALTNARASVEAAQSELARRRQLAASGSYQSRPVEEARRALVAAQSARAQSQSEVATTRANLQRARTLAAEGLISQRDLEAAQGAFDTATARLESAQADEKTAQQEAQREQQIAASDVAGAAEVQQARAALAQAQADVRTRAAAEERARTEVRLAASALARERAIFAGNIANRREVGTARAGLQSARAELYKAQRALQIGNAQMRARAGHFSPQPERHRALAGGARRVHQRPGRFAGGALHAGAVEIFAGRQRRRAGARAAVGRGADARCGGRRTGGSRRAAADDCEPEQCRA